MLAIPCAAALAAPRLCGHTTAIPKRVYMLFTSYKPFPLSPLQKVQQQPKP